MGMMSARLRRLHYVWYWRLRYWWLDTQSGERARLTTCAVGALIVVVQVTRLFVMPVVAPIPGEPQKGVWWWLVQLAIMVVSAYVSYASRPKVEPPKPQEANVPSVEDGQAVKHHFGTVWISDEYVLAWKMMGTKAIKTKGGKK